MVTGVRSRNGGATLKNGVTFGVFTNLCDCFGVGRRRDGLAVSATAWILFADVGVLPFTKKYS